MSDALTDINANEAGTEEQAHGRHRGHLSEEETQEGGAAHGRHRRAE